MYTVQVGSEQSFRLILSSWVWLHLVYQVSRYRFIYFSTAMTKHHEQGKLEKATFNMGAHSSIGLESMTIKIGNVAVGRHATGTVADS